MEIKVSLIEVVKRPIDKNCWLSVEGNTELKVKYADYIEDYDFVDFEGEVFYYDVISTMLNCFTDEFIYTGAVLITDLKEIKQLERFVKKELKTTFIKQFVDVVGILKIETKIE